MSDNDGVHYQDPSIPFSENHVKKFEYVVGDNTSWENDNDTIQDNEKLLNNTKSKPEENNGDEYVEENGSRNNKNDKNNVNRKWTLAILIVIILLGAAQAVQVFVLHWFSNESLVMFLCGYFAIGLVIFSCVSMGFFFSLYYAEGRRRWYCIETIVLLVVIGFIIIQVLVVTSLVYGQSPDDFWTLFNTLSTHTRILLITSTATGVVILVLFFVIYWILVKHYNCLKKIRISTMSRVRHQKSNNTMFMGSEDDLEDGMNNTNQNNRGNLVVEVESNMKKPPKKKLFYNTNK